jgi:hypothetical protein
MNVENQTRQKKYMEDLFDRYIKQIEGYAKIEFERVILPWLTKYHLEMRSGNGETFIHYTDNTPVRFIKKYREREWEDPFRLIDTFKIPLRVRNVLDSIVPGVNGSLGEFMPDREMINGHFKIRRTN